MGLARRGEWTWEGGQRVAGSAASAGSAALKRAGVLVRSLRLQVAEGQSQALRRQHLRWPDGRRYRATAAGRRRGHSTGRRPAAQTAGLAALVSMLLVMAVAVGSFVSASALWVKYAFHTQTDDELKANLILNQPFNIEITSKYLKLLQTRYGFQGRELLNAYNRGPSGVQAVDASYHYGVGVEAKIAEAKRKGKL